jgi:hypothetical protein
VIYRALIPKENTKQKCIKAAVKVFAEKGFRDATEGQSWQRAGAANHNAIDGWHAQL